MKNKKNSHTQEYCTELDIIDLQKNVTVSNDNLSHNLLDDDEDIKEKVTKFVESISSHFCDIQAKTNPLEEGIQAVCDFINDLFEDVIVDKLPNIQDQINNSTSSRLSLSGSQWKNFSIITL
ncbi:hypothetical protein ACTFIW_010434 [Dictyostelium discoideum]